MKRTKENPATDWATPQGILKNLGKRSIGIATQEENRIHGELVNTPGTSEYFEHQKNLIRKLRKND